MSVGNRRLLKQVFNAPALIYGMLKGSTDTAQPPDVTENGNFGVEVFDEDGNAVNPAALTKDMDGQSPTSANVTAVSEIGVAANANRVALVLVNDSDTNMYIGIGESVAPNTGIRLNAGGGTLVLSRWGALFTTEEIQAVHGGAGDKVLTIQELQ